jgi:DNA-binding transcriptional LysR family regulator
MLDLTYARSFIAVAEEMHFGRAAARLNLTQSPLSRQVQMLEQSLGVSLLERTTRAVRLTPAGRTFLKEAYRLIEAAESAETLTRRIAKGEAGLVRLGFTAASAYQALPRLVTRIRAALPGVDLVLEEMVTAELIAALETQRLDLGLLRPSPAVHGSRARQQSPDHHGIVVTGAPASGCATQSHTGHGPTSGAAGPR